MIARLLLGLWLLATVSGAAGAQDVVKVPRPPNFVRFAYHYGLLDEILRRTVGTHGPYIDQPCTEPLSTARLLQEAIKGELINVLALDVGIDLINDNMIPIPYPIDKGLLGYRVALIAGENQARIGAINNGVPRALSDARDRAATADQVSLRPVLLCQPLRATARRAGQARPRGDARRWQLRGDVPAAFRGADRRAALERAQGVELENPFLPRWVPFDRKELWF